MSLREQLSELAHRQWSGWMEYLFSKSRENADGSMTIPAWAVERWRRQMRLSYHDLNDLERDSDRAEADAVLSIIGLYLEAAQ